MNFLWAFIVGGLLCVAAQLLLDLTKLTPAHVMVIFVILGAVASGLGIYGPLVKLAGAGATVPLTSFGHALVQGVMEDLNKFGPAGLLSGGFRATATGLGAAVIFGYLVAVMFNPKG